MPILWCSTLGVQSSTGMPQWGNQITQDKASCKMEEHTEEQQQSEFQTCFPSISLYFCFTSITLPLLSPHVSSFILVWVQGLHLFFVLLQEWWQLAPVRNRFRSSGLLSSCWLQALHRILRWNNMSPVLCFCRLQTQIDSLNNFATWKTSTRQNILLHKGCFWMQTFSTFR